MDIRVGDFGDPNVVALVRLHLEGMHANSPPGSVFALDLSGLQAPDVAFFVGWEAGEPVVMGALKALDARTGEIKSMRVLPSHAGRGLGKAMLEHLLGVARSRGYTRISLETGSGEAFEPALGLYRKRGFAPGAAFGDYEKSAFNQFFHLDLS
jgi:putative acetyltransferase